MENTFNKQKYDKIIKIVNVLLKWSIFVIYVALGIILIGFIALIFIPQNLLNFDLTNLESVDIQFANIIYAINGGSFSGVVNVKTLLLVFGITFLISVSFYQFVQVQIKKLVISVKNDTPFRYSNAIILKNLGIGMLIASVLVSSVNSYLMKTLTDTLNILNTSTRLSVNVQLAFMGVIVLILAYVFSYGSSLQEEHDTTI